MVGKLRESLISLLENEKLLRNVSLKWYYTPRMAKQFKRLVQSFFYIGVIVYPLSTMTL